MGYALFAQRKLVIDGLINGVQLQHSQRGDEQQKLASQTTTLQSEITNSQSEKADRLGTLYAKLAALSSSDDSFESTKSQINNDIYTLQTQYDGITSSINQKIYLTSVKENAIEMEIKRLDTKLTALQKQYDGLKEAEGKCIDNSTPQFKGLA